MIIRACGQIKEPSSGLRSIADQFGFHSINLRGFCFGVLSAPSFRGRGQTYLIMTVQHSISVDSEIKTDAVQWINSRSSSVSQAIGGKQKKRVRFVVMMVVVVVLELIKYISQFKAGWIGEESVLAGRTEIDDLTIERSPWGVVAEQESLGEKVTTLWDIACRQQQLSFGVLLDTKDFCLNPFILSILLLRLLSSSTPLPCV